MASQNLGSVSINAYGNNADTNTANYFSNLGQNIGTISDNQNDAIVAYFEGVVEQGNTEAAKALASAVIYTAKQQQLDINVVFDQFRRAGKGELNAYIALFLNQNRVGTSYLGVNNDPLVNPYVKRAIIL